jgi:hypothetical protein
MKLQTTPNNQSTQASLARLLEMASEERAIDLEIAGAKEPVDRVDLTSQSDFLPQRREAAISELVERFPEASAERDAVLLRVLGRECRNSEDMAAYRDLLQAEDSKCDERMMYHNGVAYSSHPHGGKTFDELGQYLDKIEPIIPIVRELARPLPTEFHTLYRRTKTHHKEAETADGKFTFNELYSRGFPQFISAIYAGDDPQQLEEFGPAEETLKLAPDASYIDGIWPGMETTALDIVGVKGTFPTFDLYYKAGIDVCLYKTVDSDSDGGGWFNIYNPEVIESVS